MSLSDHKGMIERLYVEEDRTLNDVMAFVENTYGLRASKDTYKRWLKKWGLRKNIKGEVWTWANHRIGKRKAGETSKRTEIRFNGERIDEKLVQKEISRHVSTTDRLRAIAASPATPEGYSIATPGSHSEEDTVAATPGPGDSIAESNANEIKVLAEIMQTCGSFISSLGQRGVRVSQGRLLFSCSLIAEQIITGTWHLETYLHRTAHFLPMIGFEILHSTYKDDLPGIQQRLRHLPLNIFEDVTRTARFIAAAKGCRRAAEGLFTTEMQVHSRDSHGQTCLHVAVLHNHFDMVSFLIAQQADICTSVQHERVSQLLISSGADLNATVNVNELYRSAAGGHVNNVRLLLQRGMNPSIETPYRWTPLHWAARNGHAEIVKLLVEAGADVNSVSSTGQTSLGLLGDELDEIREYLKQHGAVIYPGSPDPTWSSL
ncbi:ankyrin [Aspergillus novoparasiticus]|uniref:Ankyrin n=1 Tax=Aspergillus novoparasiticus TaxID=986946 RepID=A0A5N6F8J2_9EURO|nr:ankyrin [Aspergillus novoparasiticus]